MDFITVTRPQLAAAIGGVLDTRTPADDRLSEARAAVVDELTADLWARLNAGFAA